MAPHATETNGDNAGPRSLAQDLFEDMGRLMRNELERFEREKVEDFKSGVETFLEGAVEAQKEVRKPCRVC